MKITQTDSRVDVLFEQHDNLETMHLLAPSMVGIEEVTLVVPAGIKASCSTSDTGKLTISLGAGSLLRHHIALDDAQEEEGRQQVVVLQDVQSTYESVRVASPRPSSVIHTEVHLQGEGAQCALRGLVVGGQKRSFESSVTIYHEAPHCTSTTLNKAIGADSSRTLFKGLVYVAEGAIKSDAQQSFKSLLLSDEARINTEPQLEIYNDDVKCSHGATVGQLDQRQLFYLESRGFDPETAKKMLIESFAAEVVALIADEDIRYELLSRVHAQVHAVSH